HSLRPSHQRSWQALLRKLRKIDRARPSRVNGPTPRLSSPGTATHSANAEVSTPSTKITATLGAMAGTMEPRMMYSSCQLRGRGRTIIGRRSGRWAEGADGPVGHQRPGGRRYRLGPAIATVARVTALRPDGRCGTVRGRFTRPGGTCGHHHLQPGSAMRPHLLPAVFLAA